MDDLRRKGSDPTESYFNPSVLCSPLSAAGGYPTNRGFGNLGRNVLRAPSQKRLDMALSKTTALREGLALETRWDVFNVFNTVNFATPNFVIGDVGTDFGKITDSVGGPRVMQFAVKLTF
jgi:hypothetical protein